MAAAGKVLPRSHGDNALNLRRLSPAVVVLVAAGLTWWVDAALQHRVANGTDHGARLAAILTYVGVDGAYTLARALGVTALVFAYVSVVVGLINGRSVSPPRFGAAVHRHIGAVTLALVAAHATVPFTSVVPPYGGWRTALLPLGQPVSWGIKAATWESFGLLAFYLLVLTGPTYYLFRTRTRAWAVGHRLVAVAYGLSVAHALLLGTDFLVAGPPRVLLLAAQVPLLVLLARRLAPSGTAAAGGLRMRTAGALLAAVASTVMVVLTVLIATGEYAPGMRL